MGNEMDKVNGIAGTVYHCNIDNKNYKINADGKTATEDKDPNDIKDAVEITNWRDIRIVPPNSGNVPPPGNQNLPPVTGSPPVNGNPPANGNPPVVLPPDQLPPDAGFNGGSGLSFTNGKFSINGKHVEGLNTINPGAYGSNAHIAASELHALDPGINMVRAGAYDGTTPQQVAAGVADNAKYGIVTFIEPFSDKNKVQTNSNGGHLTDSYLNDKIAKYAAVAGNNPYAIMGTGNELNGNDDAGQWVNNNATIIKKMYDSGYGKDKPIMVDAPNWGQDPQKAADHLDELKQAVFQKTGVMPNIVVNVHAYGAANNPKFENGLKALNSKTGGKWMFGESGGDVLANKTLPFAKQFDVPVLPWISLGSGVSDGSGGMAMFSQNTDLKHHLTGSGQKWMQYVHDTENQI
jgi:Cellulase (glycosyl hydrolase family 5)